jgi:bifunctional UDP-N-acetylglucosamine pyrophosphorylase / glucosamine-1-phosphate N-acetyltransferase
VKRRRGGNVMDQIAIVVLAAGMGTRMKSKLPKVLHRVAGRSLLGHVLHAAKDVGAARAVVVHGPAQDAIKTEATKIIPNAQLAEQTERKGTGHAVMQAETALKDFTGTILVLYGDVPLITAESLRKLLAVRGKNTMAVLAFEAANPFGYGRLITKGNKVLTIREQKDASETERNINLCNSGIIAIEASALWAALAKLKPANAQGELYLTDVVEHVNAAGGTSVFAICPESETAGVNDRVQLAGIEAEIQKLLRQKAMLGGATLIDPATTYFSADTKIGSDVVIEPNVFFGPGVTVGDDVEILANSHIEGAIISNGARVGPFARLRPGAELGEKSHVGNFVEIKKAKLGKGAKANHLTYIGDAEVGAGSNIGAGTITCNYDGYEKHLTRIGENVFVGSNTSIVAPVSIGSGANIAAGSVITADVPADALAMTRAGLVQKDGWAKRYRAMKAAKKAKKI